MNTPDVIMRETSNGTKNAIAESTDLKAIENKYPETIKWLYFTGFIWSFHRVHFDRSKKKESIFIPHVLAMFITNTAITDVNAKA